MRTQNASRGHTCGQLRMTAPGGVTGWTRQGSIDFDSIWENDRYVNDQPTKCAKHPGAPAKP